MNHFGIEAVLGFGFEQRKESEQTLYIGTILISISR
jgi:hypothetical protein